jgi:hypothetical protein
LLTVRVLMALMKLLFQFNFQCQVSFTYSPMSAKQQAGAADKA